MISWVLDRLPAQTVDGLVSHTIIVIREADTLAAFQHGASQVRAFTESMLPCEQRGAMEWYVPSLDLVLLTAREIVHKSAESTSQTEPSPASDPTVG